MSWLSGWCVSSIYSNYFLQLLTARLSFSSESVRMDDVLASVMPFLGLLGSGFRVPAGPPPPATLVPFLACPYWQPSPGLEAIKARSGACFTYWDAQVFHDPLWDGLGPMTMLVLHLNSEQFLLQYSGRRGQLNFLPVSSSCQCPSSPRRQQWVQPPASNNTLNFSCTHLPWGLRVGCAATRSEVQS